VAAKLRRKWKRGKNTKTKIKIESIVPRRIRFP
jgi:hypothetical protein